MPRTKLSKPQRPHRVSFKGPRLKTQLSQTTLEDFQRRGYHTAWLMEDDIPEALQSGYEHVTKAEIKGDVGEADLHRNDTDLGTNVSMIGNRPRDGHNAQRMYLMKIRLEFFKEDQAAREESARMTEAAINAGTIGGGVENSYIKSGHGIRK